MKILFFAQTRLAAGCSEFHLPTPVPLNTQELWNLLENHFPALKPLRNSTRLARNCSYASDDDLFQEGDEVALIPPVSGG